MLQDAGFRVALLNWVTSHPEIDGVYVLVSFERETKQISDSEFLVSYLDFLNEIKETGLDFVAGHLNTESLLFSVLDHGAITIGTFENTRIFSLDKFVERDDEARRGPRARIYLPGMLNWIQVDQAKQIRDEAPEVWEKVYRATSFSEQALNQATEPHFNQPPLYRHHLINICEQFDMLSHYDQRGKCNLLLEWIEGAIQANRELRGKYIELERHGDGGHLEAWRKSISNFLETRLN
jgi:hypothetical protein